MGQPSPAGAETSGGDALKPLLVAMSALLFCGVIRNATDGAFIPDARAEDCLPRTGSNGIPAGVRQVPNPGDRRDSFRGDELAAAVLCAEARGDGRRGMEAVWEVVWTRARRLGKPEANVMAVLTRRRQFACLNSTPPAALIRRMKGEAEWPVALAIVAGAPRTRLTAGADHYEISGRTPYWAVHRVPVARVGGHSFYRLKRNP